VVRNIAAFTTLLELVKYGHLVCT